MVVFILLKNCRCKSSCCLYLTITMVSSRFSIISVIIFSVFYCPDVANTQCAVSKITATFVDRIFRKYGNIGSNNYTFITRIRLNDLMNSLTLGSIEVVCQTNDTVCLKNKYAGHQPAKTDPLLSRKRRGIDAKNNNVKEHELDWKNHLARCMTLQNVISLFKVNKSGITKTDFYNICPSLVQQIDEQVCVHYHKRFPALVEPDGPPDPSETWGYGFLAITICSLLSLAVIAMIPCLNKSFYNMMMAYLIALAVGTLAGDALLHLIPHAFIEGANLAAEIKVSKDQRLRQHYSQVWRAMFVLAGIYMFFIVEQFMKLKGTLCGGNEHGHAHNHDVPMVDATENATEAGSDDKDDDSVEQEGHGHSHGGNKAITGETKVASVAWMVIVGDGFHNFSDGLAVGAAFSASISSGVSTTIAIFCHELPHELGDFAILLKAGMTIKQAIVYNLVSAILAYVGLAIGILAGEGELGRHIILSLTAGLFLYISLVDMMGELTEQETVKSRCCTVICQHIGLLSGIGIMLFISLYEHNM